MFKFNEEDKMRGLRNMQKRMAYHGYTNDDRLNNGKLWSLKKAINKSYQSEVITFKDKEYRCLINPIKLTTDYDRKQISIPFDAGMKDGDTFYWNRTQSHWITYSQRLTEEAYYRAEIERCDYQLIIDGEPYWVYVRGPVETAMIWSQKHKIEFNNMNYSLCVHITRDERTNDFITRHKVIKFDGHNWKVTVTDRYSTPGILEFYLEEYFDNKMEDAAAAPEIILPDTTQPYIDGPQLIKPYDIMSYSIVGINNGEFVVNNNKVKINSQENDSCEIEICSGKAFDFKLLYVVEGHDDIELNIKVESF